MSTFKGHQVGVSQLLEVIPEELLISLSKQTKVDYYTKILHGRKLFYLLLYGILENDRLSQRTLEDTFNDPVFKMLFDLDKSESVCRSSISERLSKIDSTYFKQIYECVYKQFSAVYSDADKLKYNLIRVDSTIVSETSNKLLEGFCSNQRGKAAVKYSTAFDGILPCLSKVFTAAEYSNEDCALPEVVRSHVKQDIEHKNIYVLDRGLQSSQTMKNFCNESIPFVIRARENRKYVELESFIGETSDMDLGSLMLIKDCKVNLYAATKTTSQKGTVISTNKLVDEPFRLIITCSKSEPEKQFWFITNDFDLSAKEITDIYKRRWDIEVFFRFIKQELNFSHFVSLSKNGIEVMLYMSLIVAMLVLTYKHANNIGYKTAKRRFNLEMRNLIISMIVVECGGNPAIYFKT